MAFFMEKEKNMLKKIIMTTILLAGLLNLKAVTFDEISERYSSLLMDWIEGVLPPGETIEEMDRLQNELSKLPDGAEKLYWDARILLAQGQVMFYQGEERQSIDYLESAQEKASDALDMDKSSDTWRVLSEAGSFIMVQKGVGYIIANSSKVQEQAEEALLLDGDNARATLIISQGLINAPKFFGGDEKKGMAMMEELVNRGDLNREDKFFILLAKAETLEEQRKKREAETVYRQILRLFPGNPVVQERL